MTLTHPRPCRCCFLSPDLVHRLAASDNPDLRKIAIGTLEASTITRTRRTLTPNSLQGMTVAATKGKGRSVHDMEEWQSPLPGKLVRAEGAGPTGDPAVDEAYEHTGLVYDFFRDVFERKSLDNAGYPIVSSVRHGMSNGNAVWDGQQIAFGDGDGTYFLRMTGALDIVCHEMAHGVVQFSSKLEYNGQPGALNESFCDVMGELILQHRASLTADRAGWVVGADVLGPALAGLEGFRTFRANRAYEDHPDFGSDRQVKHMNDFIITHEDNGGVHLNSGIPNHAFYLAAQAIGGRAWDQAGKVWYHAFVGLGPQSEFVDAANRTVIEAGRLYGRGGPVAKAFQDAWMSVGVKPEV